MLVAATSTASQSTNIPEFSHHGNNSINHHVIRRNSNCNRIIPTSSYRVNSISQHQQLPVIDSCCHTTATLVNSKAKALAVSTNINEIFIRKAKSVEYTDKIYNANKPTTTTTTVPDVIIPKKDIEVNNININNNEEEVLVTSVNNNCTVTNTVIPKDNNSNNDPLISTSTIISSSTTTTTAPPDDEEEIIQVVKPIQPVVLKSAFRRKSIKAASNADNDNTINEIKKSANNIGFVQKRKNMKHVRGLWDEENEKNPFALLHDDLLIKVFSSQYFSMKEIVTCQSVSKRWNNIVQHDNIWKFIDATSFVETTYNNVVKAKCGSESNNNNSTIIDPTEITTNILSKKLKKHSPISFTIKNITHKLNLDTNFPNIQDWNNLHTLVLTGFAALTDTHVHVLLLRNQRRNYNKLHTLQLEQCVQLTNTCLQSISTLCPNLYKLSIRGCTNITSIQPLIPILKKQQKSIVESNNNTNTTTTTTTTAAASNTSSLLSLFNAPTPSSVTAALNNNNNNTKISSNTKIPIIATRNGTNSSSNKKSTTTLSSLFEPSPMTQQRIPTSSSSSTTKSVTKTPQPSSLSSLFTPPPPPQQRKNNNNQNTKQLMSLFDTPVPPPTTTRKSATSVNNNNNNKSSSIAKNFSINNYNNSNLSRNRNSWLINKVGVNNNEESLCYLDISNTGITAKTFVETLQDYVTNNNNNKDNITTLFDIKSLIHQGKGETWDDIYIQQLFQFISSSSIEKFDISM